MFKTFVACKYKNFSFLPFVVIPPFFVEGAGGGGTAPICLEIFRLYLVGLLIWSKKRVMCKNNNTCLFYKLGFTFTVCFKTISCARCYSGKNRDFLVIFGWSVNKVYYSYHMK